MKKKEFIEITLKLDLLAKQYKELCDRFAEYKKNKIPSNSEKYVLLEKEFNQNYLEILEIKKRLDGIL